MANEKINIRLKYERELYVERQLELKEAIYWLSKKQRLLTITAGPATGKSWFLRRLEEELAAQESTQTIWIDTEELLPESDRERPPHILPECMGEWLKKFTEKLRVRCGLISNNLDQAPELVLEKIATNLTHCWPKQKICVFIDGGDELSDKAWQEFERFILEPLASESEIRFVIALRSKQKVRVIPLCISEKRIQLEVWSKANNELAPQGIAQLQLLLSHLDPKIRGELQKLLDTFVEYDQTHPGLNTFLYQLAVSTEKEGNKLPEGAILCKQALQSINSNLQDQDVDNVVNLLLGIADFEDTWSIEDLQQWLSISSSQAVAYINTLKALFLVTYLGTGKYKIADGLRPFIRNVLDIESSVTIKTGEHLDAEKRKLFIDRLADLLQEDRNKIHDMGTNQVSIEMPTESANRLKREVESGNLAGLGIEGVEFSNKHVKLRELIVRHFDLADLEILCFDLLLDFEQIGTQKLSLAVVRLIQRCDRLDRLSDLVQYCKTKRPHVDWPDQY